MTPNLLKKSLRAEMLLRLGGILSATRHVLETCTFSTDSTTLSPTEHRLSCSQYLLITAILYTISTTKHHASTNVWTDKLHQQQHCGRYHTLFDNPKFFTGPTSPYVILEDQVHHHHCHHQQSFLLRQLHEERVRITVVHG